MDEYMGLDALSVGEKTRVVRIDTRGSMRRRFSDIGLTENTVVECVGVSPLGDPKAYLIRGSVMAIRGKDAKSVRVLPKPASQAV